MASPYTALAHIITKRYDNKPEIVSFSPTCPEVHGVSHLRDKDHFDGLDEIGAEGRGPQATSASFNTHLFINSVHMPGSAAERPFLLCCDELEALRKTEAMLLDHIHNP
jgi:hypothetical protein